MKNDLYEQKGPGIVFYIAAPLVALFVLWGAFGTRSLEQVSNTALALTLDNFGWFYMLATALFIAFMLFLAVSPFGKLKLGQSDETPKYSFYTWLGMLFSAGLGVGFVFWGVAEPALYYLDPHPDYVNAPDDVRAAAGLRYAVFHWALHPWAIFSLIGLTLAYVQYKKNQPALISSAFHPLIGNKIHGPLGKGIDVLAVLATSTGVATTFGLSALQISGGLSHLTTGAIPATAATQLIVIAIVTVLFIFSAATGVDKGIRILSNISLAIAAVLLIFILAVGPSLFIAQSIVTTLGSYLANVVQMSLDLNPFGDGEWLGTYTIFFWAWHISWAPFIGLFVARISRGRTIREFAAGVLIVPSLLSVIWFTALGGTALDMVTGGNEQIGNLILENVEVALFATLAELPFGLIMSVLAVILIMIFFVTSADSASYVLAVITSDGSLEPKLSIKVIWGFLIASTAGVLLLTGGLEGLQTASIVAALPFAIIMVVMIFSLIIMLGKDLKSERRVRSQRQSKKVKKEVYEEFYDSMKEEVSSDVKKEVYSEIKEEVYEQVKEEVYEEIKEGAIEEIKEKVYKEIDADISNTEKDALQKGSNSENRNSKNS